MSHLYSVGARGAVCHHLAVLSLREQLACDFDDALATLEYWRDRRARLPWHRRSARREADAMIDAWERRIRWAVLLDRTLPVVQRLDGGLLALRTRGGIVARRWRHRAYAAGLVMAAVAGAMFALVSGLF
jgi:hypothetical protein